MILEECRRPSLLVPLCYHTLLQPLQTLVARLSKFLYVANAAAEVERPRSDTGGLVEGVEMQGPIEGPAPVALPRLGYNIRPIDMTTA